jgi:hypothetical protein
MAAIRAREERQADAQDTGETGLTALAKRITKRAKGGGR